MTQHRAAGLRAGRAAQGRLHASRQAGVGLIEVLMAVLVLSIGFLGIAALQAHSLSINNGAMSRTMATVASYSILDAMRTDIASAEGSAYNTTVTANACPAASTTLASVQLNQWCGQLAATLGASASTTGTITCGNTGVCTITIAFDDSRSGTAGTGSTSGVQTITTKAML